MCQYFFDFETDSLGSAVECPDSRWVQYPEGRWSCSTDQPLSGFHSLRHSFDNTEAGCDFILFTHDPVGDDGLFTCTFRVRHGYSPSVSNNWQVALLATFNEEFPAAGTGTWITRGVILGVNQTGSDDHLVLWQCDQGQYLELCRTPLNYQEQVGPSASPRFSVKLDPEGNATVSGLMEPGGEESILGTGRLNSRPAGRQLVVRYQYSPAQDRKLWLDDLAITGPFMKDTLPPEILSAEVGPGESITLIFSEFPHQIQGASFKLQWAGGAWCQPEEWIREKEAVILRFGKEFPNREWMQLRVTGICDLDGNCLQDTMIALRRNNPVWGDLVFNEVMADPEPAVKLPEREYVELYNRSGEQFNLTGWLLEVNGRVHRLDSQKCEPGPLLSPGHYAVLSGFNLPNEGGELILLDVNGTLVHAVTYANPWEAPGWKQEGGWALESPDPERICGISRLWEYSTDPRGGTPGKINSQHTLLNDTDPPQLLYTGFRDDQALFSLYFSETVRHHRWVPSQFPITPGGLVPDLVAPSFPFSDRIDLRLPGDRMKGGEWTVTLPMLTDCSGNICRTMEAAGGFPGTLRFGSILISEVMFAPREGAPEYVELFNPGPGYFDLLDLCLDISEESGTRENLAPVSSHSRLIPPGAYLVLTENVEYLVDAYHLEMDGRWVGMKPWKGLGNQGGFISLTDRAGQTVDQVPFGEQLHMELIGDTRGVSLERIDFTTPGDEPGNWHSAASIAGFATPGAPNSQRAIAVNAEKIIQVRPRVFSPDNDGFEDLMAVTVSPGGHGWTIYLLVTDLEGRRIRMLANNDLCGPLSSYRWDGTSDGGHMVPEGIYILHARGYHAQSGKVWRQRVSLGVIYR